MKRLWLCFVLLGCVAVTALAANSDGAGEKRGGACAPGALARNVKLTFAPLEEDDKGIYIVTASPEFESGVTFNGADGSFVLEVSGSVALLDDDRIYVRFHFMMRGRGESEENGSSVSTGIILKDGQQLDVTRMDGKSLMVGASFVE